MSRRMLLWIGLAGGNVCLSSSGAAMLPAPAVSLSTLATDGYFAGDINSVAPNKNAFATFGNYEFVAFYDRTQGSDLASVKIGRRLIGSSTWTVVDTGKVPNSITDDHDTVAIAVDGAGHLHMSWGMHNNHMNYVVSSGRVDGATFSLPAFSTPSVWSNVSDTSYNSATYPEFYKVPGTGDLLFTYRQGGVGGGSGNGDQYYVRYDAATGTFGTKTKVINGQADSVNAYLNTHVYTSTGNLLVSWTWRSTPAFQSNQNIMFAQSPDNGATWFKQDGSPFTLPITMGQGGVIANIPQGSTLINQASMTVDKEDRPMIATWWAPATAEGDYTRQYMLEWYDGSAWRTSQITHRPTEALQDDTTVRDLARPIVLVDDQDRTLVVMRYKEISDSIVVAISDDKINWSYVTLSTTNMGDWEPTYDADLWATQNELSLLFQPLGATAGSGTVQVLDWDERAYFAAVPEPGVAPVAGLLAFAVTAFGRSRR